jgi:hypothetical protein
MHSRNRFRAMRSYLHERTAIDVRNAFVANLPAESRGAVISGAATLAVAISDEIWCATGFGCVVRLAPRSPRCDAL